MISGLALVVGGATVTVVCSRPTAEPMPMMVLAPVVNAAPALPEPSYVEVAAKLLEVPETILTESPATAVVATPKFTGPTFDGRPLRKARTMTMVVTAYSPDSRSCGPNACGITASGYSVWTNGMNMVAADTRLLPFGTIISVPGYNDGKPVPVLDRGGKIKGHRLDVLYPTHEIAQVWGRQTINVTVWEYAD